MRSYEEISYTDGKGTVESMTQTLFDASGEKLKTLVYGYTYGDPSKGQMPDALYELSMGGRTFWYSYDSLGRLTEKLARFPGKTATESYTYKANEDDSDFTTPVVETLTDYAGVTHTYTYDTNGNILTDTYDGNTVSYEYDSLNRMTRFNDPVYGWTYVYVYDARGNIVELQEHSYTTGALTPYYHSYKYTYGDNIWADLMTAYDGVPITYDEIGNPLNWINGETLTWQNGKQLASFDGTVNYSYTADGLRVAKSGAKNTEYYIIDGQYIGESTTIGNTTYLISYFYDENGSPAGIYVNDAVYYFAKNVQGDVTAILDYQGNIVAKYTYDAYGYLLSVTNANGNDITSATHVANLNPFRYRGYMYDSESGFYYLRSRYYDPYIGRFLNADNVISGTSDSVNGYNLFAYCFNNPIMYTDNEGSWPDLSLLVKGTLAATIGVLTVTAVVATGGTCAPLVALGYSVLATAGTVMAVTGASEVSESFTGKNPIKDRIGEDGFEKLQTAAEVVISMGPEIIASGSMSVCFVAGTEVSTAQGHIPIEEVAVGMLVYATDPQTGETTLKPVAQTFVNKTDQLIHLKFNGESITTTPEHPFWIPQKGWVSAINLRAGDMLQLLNGEYVVLEAVQHELLETPITVYNFEVEDFHTYYVSQCSVLVHNSCGGLISGKPSKPDGAQMIRRDSAKVKSQEFIDFIRSSGKSFKSSEWKYRMETWVTETGEYIERHYWYNKVTGESYYHK